MICTIINDRWSLLSRWDMNYLLRFFFSSSDMIVVVVYLFFAVKEVISVCKGVDEIILMNEMRLS